MKNFDVLKLSPDTMLIQIETDKLSVEEQNSYFGKEYSKLEPNETLEFIQEEDFIFDKDLLLYMGLDTRYYLLKKGNYPLEFFENKVIVTLKLSDSCLQAS